MINVIEWRVREMWGSFLFRLCVWFPSFLPLRRETPSLLCQSVFVRFSSTPSLSFYVIPWRKSRRSGLDVKERYTFQAFFWTFRFLLPQTHLKSSIALQGEIKEQRDDWRWMKRFSSQTPTICEGKENLQVVKNENEWKEKGAITFNWLDTQSEKREWGKCEIFEFVS